MDDRTVLETGVVTEEGLRVDRWASENFVKVPTRGSARKACKRGEILLNGQVVESSRFVRVGDEVTLLEGLIRHPAPPLRPRVFYADERCALVMKPAGLLVNGNRFRTLEHALPNVLEPSSEPDGLRFARPVHRLDYETCGVVAVARCHRAMVAWGKAFEERRVTKRYRAFVVGRLEGEGTVDAPLDGREAVSHYRVVSWFRSLKPGWCTEVELVPHTGRMHQLRRHMHALGHPILGDRRYNLDGVFLRGSGLFLVAEHLALPDPDGVGPEISACADLPGKFASFRTREERRWARWHGMTPGG